jgi:hypothetical protein
MSMGMGMGQPSKEVHPKRRAPTREVKPTHRAGGKGKGSSHEHGYGHGQQVRVRSIQQEEPHPTRAIRPIESEGKGEKLGMGMGMGMEPNQAINPAMEWASKGRDPDNQARAQVQSSNGADSSKGKSRQSLHDPVRARPIWLRQ